MGMSCKKVFKQSRAMKPRDALVFLQECVEIGSGHNKSSAESIEYTTRMRREINIIKKLLATKKIKSKKHQKQAIKELIQSVADRKMLEASKLCSYSQKIRKNRPRLKQKPVDLWKQHQNYLRSQKPKKLNMVQRIVGQPKKSTPPKSRKKSLLGRPKKSKKGMCEYCYQLKVLTKEHVLPKSMGGTYIIGACRQCNADRGANLSYSQL